MSVVTFEKVFPVVCLDQNYVIYIKTQITNTHTHTHTAGTPGPVKTPVALPDSQSQIFISWLFPIDHNVLDPVLLRYELYYTVGTTFNTATATRITELLPVLLNGTLSGDGVVETTLTGLDPGTTYTVTLRALGPTATPDGLEGDKSLVSTFGTGK